VVDLVAHSLRSAQGFLSPLQRWGSPRALAQGRVVEDADEPRQERLADLPPEGLAFGLVVLALPLGVSRATVYRLIQERRLGHVRVSNAVKVLVEQLNAYVEASIVRSA
jgi:excisionase family DNA binding protein